MVYVCGLAPAITVAIKQPYGGVGWRLICLMPAGSIYAWGRVLAVSARPPKQQVRPPVDPL
eukprot:8277764-Pyramimonas_sp.AAC.1